MQYYPVFDMHSGKFIGIYKNRSSIFYKRIEFFCSFDHTVEETVRHTHLMNEIAIAAHEKRHSAITTEDQKFIDYYNSFYLEICDRDCKGHEIAEIDSKHYSQAKMEHIKEYLAFYLPKQSKEKDM